MQRAKKARRSNPEFARVIAARPQGAQGPPIADLDYDEVTDLLDVVLQRTAAATETSTQRVREVAKKIGKIASDGPPPTPQRKIA
jgi:hypothetical protein